MRRRCTFLRTRAEQIRQQVCVPLCEKIQMDNNQTTKWSMIQRLDIIEPRVLLLNAPGFARVVLCEDCLDHRVLFKSKSDRGVPRVEQQIKRQLVCTRVKSKLNIVVVNDDMLNSNFHSTGSN